VGRDSGKEEPRRASCWGNLLGKFSGSLDIISPFWPVRMIPSDLLMCVADGHFWKLFERDHHVRDMNQINAKADDRSVFQCHNRNCCFVLVFKTTVKLQRTFGE
jgi:hypothetical protein